MNFNKLRTVYVQWVVTQLATAPVIIASEAQHPPKQAAIRPRGAGIELYLEAGDCQYNLVVPLELFENRIAKLLEDWGEAQAASRQLVRFTNEEPLPQDRLTIGPNSLSNLLQQHIEQTSAGVLRGLSIEQAQAASVKAMLETLFGEAATK